MKQNERLLIYAVTGFLAVILVIAVVFGRDPGRELGNGAKSQGSEVQGLGQLLDGVASARGTGDKSGAPEANRSNGVSGLPTPGQVTAEQPPLMANGSPAQSHAMLAADLVVQQLGASRRDRTVRFVRAKAGDSLDSLVRRWCGARDPYLADAKCLNEDLVVLREGQEVGVPWIDDEVLLTGLDAAKPKPPSASPLDALAAANSRDAKPTEATGRPSFAEPGQNDSSRAPALAAGKPYTVKSGDSLWRIADRVYGRKNADRMIQEIRRANPGLDERLSVGQKLVLPAN